MEQIRVASILCFSGVLISWSLYAALGTPKVKQVQLALPNWPQQLENFTICLISDVHIGSILRKKFAHSVTMVCNAVEADIICATGDLVDGPVDKLAPEVEPFKALRAKHGVYFVTGNHEVYAVADPWCEHFKTFGWHVLRNNSMTLPTSPPVAIMGVDDPSGAPSGTYSDIVKKVFDNVPVECPKILLAHQPQIFKWASTQLVDLQLSGHTHGGQMWPFSWLAKLHNGYLAGTYVHHPSTLYVSRGTGFWGPPMRLFAPAEITKIVLTRAISPTQTPL